jgi:hypothetical protein
MPRRLNTRRPAVSAAEPSRESKPPTLAEHLRRGTFTAAELGEGITYGDVIHVPFRRLQVVATSSSRRRRPVPEQLRGAWFPRPPQKRGRHAGEPRFATVEDRLALAMMACRFAHAATWPLMWAILWRRQSEKYFDLDQPVPISVDELIQATGYSHASVHRGLAELRARGMLTVQSGGGRHHKSAFRLTDVDQWLDEELDDDEVF